MIKTNLTPIHLRLIPLTSGEKKPRKRGVHFLFFVCRHCGIILVFECGAQERT